MLVQGITAAVLRWIRRSGVGRRAKAAVGAVLLPFHRAGLFGSITVGPFVLSAGSLRSIEASAFSLLPGEVALSTAPEMLPRSRGAAPKPPSGPIEFPSLKAQIVDAAIVRGNSDGAIVSGGVVLPRGFEERLGPFPHAVIPGFVRSSEGHFVALNRVRQAPAGILLGGPWPGNYYHWMNDVLPRLWLADHFVPAVEGWPLLVAEPALRLRSVRESIEAIAPGRVIFQLDTGVAYRPEQALVIDGASTAVGVREDRIPSGTYLMHGSAMRGVREALFRGLGVTPPTGPGQRRILIERPAGSLRNYNREDVRKALEPLDFEVIDPSTLSLRDQAALFAEAEVVCGPSGAALANLLFVPEQARVVVWGLESAWEIFGMWSNLAAVGGARIGLVPVPVEPDLTITQLTSLRWYGVDCRELVEALTDFGVAA